MDGNAQPPARFDPFNIMPVFPGKLKDAGTGWIVTAGLAVLLVTVVVTVIDGSFGTASDFRFVTDLRYLFSGSVPRTEPRFPLLRDASSVLFFALVVAGFVLLHRLWRDIGSGLRELRDTQMLVPRRRPRSNAVSRLLGLDWMLRGCADYEALDRLEDRLGNVSPRTKALLTIFVAIASFAFATVLGNSLSQNLFRVLAPTDATPEEQEHWLTLAKQNWWAGPNHPAGLVIYSAMAILAVTLIIVINVVGITAVYVVVALYFVAEPRADWYNRDGRYGWTPVARVFRSAYWALALFGMGIAMLVMVLGPNVSISVVSLIVLYLLLVPVYTLVPWLVFRTVEGAVKKRRHEELSTAVKDIDEHDLAKRQLYVTEFTYCRHARIRPMRLRTASAGAFTTVVLLPILLTLLQIYAQIGLGSR
jgi:hypothetical protein